LLGGLDLKVYLVVLDGIGGLLGATTTKIVIFYEEKSAPLDKILATPMRIFR